MRPLVLVLTLLPGAAWADAPSWALGVAGPGPDRGRMAIGAGVTEAAGVGPSVAVDYVRGLSPAVDLYATGDWVLLVPGGGGGEGALGIVGLGAQVRATERDAGLHFALRGGPEVMLFGIGGAQGFMATLFGVAPGFAVGFGADAVQVTVGVDVPLYFFGAIGVASNTVTGANLSVTVRPSVSVEGRLVGGLGWFVTATHDRLLTGPGGGGGIVYTGAQAGLVF